MHPSKYGVSRVSDVLTDRFSQSPGTRIPHSFDNIRRN